MPHSTHGAFVICKWFNSAQKGMVIGVYKALYRKWRPTDFDTVSGQNHVTDVLKYQVANNKVSHAYLFCGSRGTGKTTCAKIMAKAVNCLNPQNGNPCNACAACQSINDGLATDVIEMDAASNNGVDNVRDIREEVVFMPAELRYRVYIIDEVHMLSASAFNALLKTLEEPPSHVIFILATTELQKLPSTIISRCQHYDFKRISMKDLTARLKVVADAEGIVLDESGALVIARMAQGGMRDAISLLELCAGSGERINEENAVTVLGAGNRKGIFELIDAVSAKDYSSIYEKIALLSMESKDLAAFWQELIDTYRDMMVVRTCQNAKDYLDLTENEYEGLKALSSRFSMDVLVYHSKLLEDALYAMQRVGFSKRSTAEITLTRMCEPRLSTSVEALLARIAKLEEEVSRLKVGALPAAPIESAKIEQITPEQMAERNIIEEPAAVLVNDPVTVARASSQSDNEDAYRQLSYWDEIVETAAERKPSIAGFLAKTKAYYSVTRGFMIQVASDFVANVINRPDILVDVKSLISEHESRNILNEPFEILSVGKSASYRLLDELIDSIDS